MPTCVKVQNYMYNIELSDHCDLKFKHQVSLVSRSELSSRTRSFPSSRDPTKFTGMSPAGATLYQTWYEVVKKECRFLTPMRKQKREDGGGLHKCQVHSSENSLARLRGSTFFLHIPEIVFNNKEVFSPRQKRITKKRLSSLRNKVYFYK